MPTHHSAKAFSADVLAWRAHRDAAPRSASPGGSALQRQALSYAPAVSHPTPIAPLV